MGIMDILMFFPFNIYFILLFVTIIIVVLLIATCIYEDFFTK